MKPRVQWRKHRPLALAMALVLSTVACSTPLAAGEPADDVAADGEGQFVRPSATFFTINEVLAKLDRERSRGSKAVRLVLLSPPSTSVMMDVQPEQSTITPVGSEPFGLFTFRAPDNVLWTKWRGLEGDIAREKLVLESCRNGQGENCPAHAAQFLRLIKAVKLKTGRAQLEEANQAVNAAIRYVSDLSQFGELDRWSAPLASFATGKGDCEDYAIAKYVALREVGFPEEDLRLLLVRDRTVRQDHAVLAARLDNRWLILDNRWSELREDTADLRFTPLFAINHTGVHLFAAPYAKAQPGEAGAVPAAAAESSSDWTGMDLSNPSETPIGTLTLVF